MKKEDRIRLAQKNKDEGNAAWILALIPPPGNAPCAIPGPCFFPRFFCRTKDMFKAQKFDDAMSLGRSK